MVRVKQRVNNPESALLLDELYIDTYCDTRMKDSEDVFGVALFRNVENINDFSRYKLLVTNYMKLDIKKFFHMSLESYMKTTSYEKEILNELAMEEIQRLETAHAEIENSNRNTSHDINEMFDI